MSDNDAVWIAFWAVVVILTYGLIARGLFRATEGLRYSLLDLSAPLLDSNAFPEDEKQGVEAALSDVHSAWAAWRILHTLFHVIFLLPWEKHEEFEKLERRVPANLRACYDTFRTRWVVATIANSPMACALFSLLVIARLVLIERLFGP